MGLHRRHLGIVALAAVMILLTACITSTSCPKPSTDAGASADATERGDAPISDADVASLTLAPGETVTGVDGVTIGAPAGTLDQPLALHIEQTADPAVETPLPEHVRAVGQPYAIRASREINTPGDRFLLLGLPVPAGVSTDTLAVAILVPRGTMEYDGEDLEGPLWSIVRGSYDRQSGLFGALVSYLGAPHVFQLVAGDDYSAEESSEASQQTGEGLNLGFRVRCIGFTGTACTADHREQTRAALAEIFAHYVGELGFLPPRLRITPASISFFPMQWVADPSYEYELQRFTTFPPCRGSGGLYLRTTRQAMTCFRGAPDTPGDLTTRHEFFHALQYAYPAFFDNASVRERVIVEATARLAEMSQAELSRSTGSPPRNVTTGLFRNAGDDEPADLHDYYAQDFFLYLGKRMGAHIDYLIPLLQRGGLRADLEALLQSGAPFPPGYSLGEAYWEWVRTITFEKSLVLGEWGGWGTVPDGEPCAFFSRAAATDSIDFSPSRWEQATSSFEVAPLASRVIRIAFAQTSDAYWTTAQVASLPPQLRIKFYEDTDSGTTRCLDRPEAAAHRFTGGDRWATGYILVSNTGLTGSATLQIAFTEPEAAPLPVAQDDVVSTIGSVPISINVLANDVSPSGSALSIVDLGTPKNGSATLSATGERIVYLPAGSHPGEDTFSYTVRNEEGLEASAAVQLTVAQRLRVLLPSPLEGTLESFHGVNARGQAALDTILADGRRRAQFMHEDTSFIDLGTLGGSESAAMDINDHGTVVGWSDTAGALRRAFIWDASAGMRDLGTLGGAGSSALAVNNHGDIVGASEADSSGFRATLWHGAKQVVDLGAHLPGNSMATGIDDNHLFSTVVGYHVSDAITHQPAPHAFLWNDANGDGQADASEFVMLGTLGGNGSMALGINVAGQIVGQSHTASGTTGAFLWQDGTLTPLGTLGGGFSTATAINAHGQVVGEAERGDGSRRAFLWSEGIMMEVGDDLMPSGWALLSLAAINDRGQLAGTARDTSGNNRAVLLTPSL